MCKNTTGINNVGIGISAMQENTTGADNAAVGRRSLIANTTGACNTALGSEALGAVTTAGNNVGIGAKAGCNITTGSQNTMLGLLTRTNAVGDDNNVVIGGNNVGKGNNTGFINTSEGSIYQGNNNSAWATTSDRRIKKNIVDNNIGLDKISQIQVRNFEYRIEEEITDFENAESAVVKKEGIQLGAIAQEIELILPDVVIEESTGVKRLDTTNLTWYMINAIKELKKEIDLLKNK